MTYRELEKLVLALPAAEAMQLAQVLMDKWGGVRESHGRYIVEGGSHAMEIRLLIEKLSYLPPERQSEVGDFIDFLCHRESTQLADKDFTQASEEAFARVWENDDDAAYDKL